MHRGLVILSGTETGAKLLREAAEHAAATDASLVLLSVFTHEEYEHDLEVLNRIASIEHAQIGEKFDTDFARDVGEQLAKKALAEIDVDYTVVGVVSDRRIGKQAVRTATKNDCDHIFLLSKPRAHLISPLGEAARRVLHEFDDFVTIAREQSPDRHFARLHGSTMDDSRLSLVTE